jgi:UDP-2-acetamido-3-amino-2,3-dideoxy-glucuronate N-acetyltransferase
LEDYVTCASSAAVAAKAVVRKGTYLGLKCSVKGSLTIGSYATIGMGAVVTKDVKDDDVIMGTPGKSIGFKPSFSGR